MRRAKSTAFRNCHAGQDCRKGADAEEIIAAGVINPGGQNKICPTVALLCGALSLIRTTEFSVLTDMSH